MDPETIEASAVADELSRVEADCPPMRTEPRVACGVWTRDIEALCRALDAQQRAHFPSTAGEKK